MTSDLRAIAVSVEAADSGYRWLHLEKQPEGDVWAVLDRSPEPSATYHQAMAVGLVALEHLIDDLAVGPRSTKRENTRHRNKPDAGDDRQDEQLTAKHSTGYFGFGPAM